MSCLALTLSVHGGGGLERYLATEGYPMLGDHFFTHSLPTFSLWKEHSVPHPLAVVSKKAEMNSPDTVCRASHGVDSVKWLYLTDDLDFSRGGIDTVYRLETAGGERPTHCGNHMEHFEVPYAAQYWIYGSSS